MDVPVVIREHVLEEIKAELFRAQGLPDDEEVGTGHNLESTGSFATVEEIQSFAARLSNIM